MIRFAEVVVGRGGGVRCARCHGEPDAVEYRDAADVRAEVSAVCGLWAGPPGPNIVFTGAEPYNHPDLPLLVSAAVEARCQRVCLDTDAVACRSIQNAGGSLMAGVRQFRWTLLGGSPDGHDTLLGRAGALDASVEGVRSFRSVADDEGMDVNITAVVPVCRHNVHDLPAAVGLAARTGADSVHIRVEDGALDLKTSLAWIVAACDTGVVNGVWVEVDGIPFCLLPGYDLHVSDAVRPRCGSKSPVCASCALEPVCGGAPASASAGQLALLSPPSFAAGLAVAVMRSRGEVVR